MAGNSVKALRKWLGEESRLLGWGLIIALEKQKANLLISQEYINRFTAGSYLPCVNGEVELIGDSNIEMLHNFVLDVPLLSFDEPDISNSRATLSMSLVGGNQVTVKKEGGHWKPTRINIIDPLQGPTLTLQLLLIDVPGDIVERRVRLDLGKSDDFAFTAVGMTQHEKEKIGNLFKDTFKALDPAHRIIELGTLRSGLNRLMEPQSFELRTQASEQNTYLASAENDGAILVLVRMMNGQGGNYPGPSYKYLIPEEPGRDYSATLLFDRNRVVASILSIELADLLNISPVSDFDFSFNGSGELTSASVRSGELPMLEIDEILLIWLSDMPTWVDFKSTAFALPYSSDLGPVIEFSNKSISLRWRSETEFTCEMFEDKEFPGPGPVYSTGVRFVIDLCVTYELVDDEIKGAALKPGSFALNGSTEFLEPPPEGWSNTFAQFTLARVKTRMLELASDKLQARLEATFNTDIFIDAFIKETIELGFGQAIQGEEVYAPLEPCFFGRINPALTSFVISPLRPIVARGSSLQFTVDPPVPGLTWSVHDLVPGVRTHSNLGSIDANGLYTAPPLSPSDGGFIRLRVRATDPSSEYESTALVSVVASGVTVNPLIQVCGVGSNVELAAGALEEGELSWSIKNPSQWSGSIEPSVEEGGDHTYRHGPVSADPNLTFILDELEVKSSSGSVGSAHVLSLNRVPFGTVNIVSMDAKTGKVEFELTVNSIPQIATWSIPFGKPEQIVGTDMKAVYTVDDTSSRYYELIFGMIDTPFGRAEGYFILPLPLSEFPAVTRKLLGSRQ